MNFAKGAMIAISLGVLASCSQEYILPGEREDLRSANPETLGAEVAAEANAAQTDVTDTARPIALPGQVNHASWTHLGGGVTHRIQHPAFSASPQLRWTANIGQGNDRKHRITAEPVVAGGRVFTLDSRAQVVATSTSGATAWVRDLTPPTDSADDASGGGLAYDNGTVYVTSGFGIVSALDAATGNIRWQQRMDAPGSGAPTVADGLVYVVSRDNTAWAIETGSGRVKWRLAGTPSQEGVVGVSSPAIAGAVVLLPFASGEIVAALKNGGIRTWSSLIAGERAGRGYSIITDVTGEPVVKDGVIYTGNPVGRMVALTTSGDKLWTAREGAVGHVWVTGGSVFLVSDEGELVRLDAGSGERIWGARLPHYVKSKARRLKSINANFGPVLAGGKLWVASSDGIMRGFNPTDGSLVSQTAIPGGAATRPVVVSGTAYLVSRDGKLLALR